MKSLEALSTKGLRRLRTVLRERSNAGRLSGVVGTCCERLLGPSLSGRAEAKRNSYSMRSGDA